MTNVANTRPVRREVTRERGRDLIVRLAPEGIYLREKGRRTAYLLPYGVAYVRGAMLAADQLRRDKAAARKERAKARSGR